MTWKKILSILMRPTFWVCVAAIAVLLFVLRLFSNRSVEPVSYNPLRVRKNSAVYSSIADSLQTAMDTGPHPGTDEDTLFELVDHLNSDELKKVYNVFGMRTNRDMTMFARPAHLIDWFRSELSGSDYDRMKKIWSSTGLWQ